MSEEHSNGEAPARDIFQAFIELVTDGTDADFQTEQGDIDQYSLSKNLFGRVYFYRTIWKLK